ncbi:MAG: sulfotransferase [Anaerolineae bacterium]|nr:MAG: sulfotransferase [Anaerolineae bacterium]
MPPINVFAFNSLRNWRRVLQANPPVAPKYRPKLARFLVTSVLSEPLRLYERRRYGETLRSVTVHDTPLFIMGPARSGTTHLHNLIALDPNFGYVSTLQGVAPGFVVGSGKWLRALVRAFLPETRPMDNVAVSLDAPQEEEVAMANVSPHTFMHHLLFPREAHRYFERYYLLQGLAPEALAEWREDYLSVLRVATYLSGGKPLVLKTPINNGRLPQLLQLFPRARFIHIHRDPFRIFLSTRNMYRKILPPHQLQDIDFKEVERNNVHFLAESMRKWMQDRRRIPQGRIVDVRYEDLVANPLEELQRLYAALELPVKNVLPRWKTYLASLQGYRPNRLAPSPEDLTIMREHLGFLFDAWEYDFPS